MAECAHDRVYVINVLGDGTPTRYVFWRERCTHCGWLILSRALSGEVPDRVIHFLRNYPRG